MSRRGSGGSELGLSALAGGGGGGASAFGVPGSGRLPALPGGELARAAAPPARNLMYDRRVVRGSTIVMAAPSSPQLQLVRCRDGGGGAAACVGRGVREACLSDASHHLPACRAPA